MNKHKERLLNFYRANETKIDIGFFLGGFVLDVFTLSDIDNLYGIAQQLIYLFILGTILYFDFLSSNGLYQIPERFQRVWNYRQPIMHFFLGSLLSLYSLFFLKSASFFSSIIFVIFLVGLMIANEMQRVRSSEVIVKVALYVICIFSFFSMMVPVVLGFVGLFPFILSLILTAFALYGIYWLLRRRVENIRLLLKSFVAPGTVVLSLFLILYIMGWIPPVPLSIQKMGIYHKIEKTENQYVASHEKPSWVFWRTGDQKFKAEPGDVIYFFAQIFSPARFSDDVILHWQMQSPTQGWQTTDQVPMSIKGGKADGYRGFVTKQNYQDGEWRILVKTTDGREIGRIYFDVTKTDAITPDRYFQTDIY